VIENGSAMNLKTLDPIREEPARTQLRKACLERSPEGAVCESPAV